MIRVVLRERPRRDPAAAYAPSADPPRDETREVPAMSIDGRLGRPRVAPMATSVPLALAQPLLAQPLPSWNDSPAKQAIVHHTDADRERAYERAPGIGELKDAMAEAKANGWIVVDMKRDWKKVYAFE